MARGLAFGIFRPARQASFLAVVGPYFVTLSPSAFLDRAADLALLFLAFSVLLYAGIYLVNDLADVRADSRHPLKRQRPLASGRLSRRQAQVLSAALILSGLSLAACLSRVALAFSLLLLLLNVAYSFWLKRIPYLELVVNTATLPLRVVLGLALFAPSFSGHAPLVVAAAGVYLSVNCVKRHAEIGNEHTEPRQGLRAYSERGLQIGALLGAALAGVAVCTSPGWQAATFAGSALGIALLVTSAAVLREGRLSRAVACLLTA